MKCSIGIITTFQGYEESILKIESIKVKSQTNFYVRYVLPTKDKALMPTTLNYTMIEGIILLSGGESSQTKNKVRKKMNEFHIVSDVTSLLGNPAYVNIIKY